MINFNDIQTFINALAALITSLGIIFAVCYSVYKFLNKPKENKETMDEYKKETDKRMENFEKEIKSIKKDLTIQTKCLLAIMDGLKQLGADGEVTKCSTELNEHVIASRWNNEDDGK